MGLILESYISEVLLLMVTLLWMLYLYVTAKYNYWKEKGVLYVEPSFPFGALKDVVSGKLHIGELYKKFYDKYRDQKYVGIYEGRGPTLILIDPDVIKHVLIKDFNHFHDRMGPSLRGKLYYIDNHLFNMFGDEWKPMRIKLTPTFTSGKMKLMFPLMMKIGKEMNICMEKLIATNPTVDIKDVLSKFTMDIIGSYAFGLEVNSLSNENSEFYQYGQKLFKPSRVSNFQRLFMYMLPFLIKFYTFRFTPEDCSNFFKDLVEKTVAYREKNNIKRNDFLDLLIQIRQNKSLTNEEEVSNGHSHAEEDHGVKEGLTIEEMTAQAFVFFAAGFETASSTMTFCLYELAKSPEIQEKLYNEISEVLARHDGQLTYQAVQEMSYLEKVVNETLRLYASLAVLHRTCTEPYKMPGTDLVLEKGQRVVIPTFAIHHDPQHYPDPEHFDPERFTPEQIKERHSCLHLPFGNGPRMCIGMRFGLLQTKMGLSEMISNFKFELTKDTPVPIKLRQSSFITQPEKPILLHVSKR